MSILSSLTPRAIVRKLSRAGFRFIYAKGSHYFFQHPVTERLTSVPMHAGRDVGRGLLSKILKQAGISVKEFIEL